MPNLQKATGGVCDLTLCDLLCDLTLLWLILIVNRLL
jgi:hypothetical protein